MARGGESPLFLLDHGEKEGACELARGGESPLLLEYWERTRDTSVVEAASASAREICAGCRASHERLAAEIGRLAGEYLAIVHDLPGHDEPEAAQVEREVIGSTLREVAGGFQRNLAAWRRSAQMLTQAGAGADGWDGLAEEWRQDCRRCRDELARVLRDRDLGGAGKPLLVYWLAAESLRAVQGRPLEKLPFSRNLVQVLSGFHSTLAWLAIDLGLPEETYDWLMEEELTRFPDRHRIFFERLGRWITRGRLDEAQAQLARLPGQDNENVHLYWSRLFQKRGDLTQAASHLKRELELYPNRTDLISELVQLNALPQAEIETLLAKVAATARLTQESWLSLARIRFTWGDIGGARGFVARALEVGPRSPAARALLRSIRMREIVRGGEREERVRAEVRELLKPDSPGESPEPGFWLEAAQFFLSIDDLDSARTYLEREMSLHPENPWGWAMRMNFLLGKPPAPEAEIRQCLDHLGDGTPDWHLLRSRAHHALGEPASCWHELLGALPLLEDPAVYRVHAGLFSVLDEVAPEAAGIEALTRLFRSIQAQGEGRGIGVYLSFLKHGLGWDIPLDLPPLGLLEYIQQGVAPTMVRKLLVEKAAGEIRKGDASTGLSDLRSLLGCFPQESPALL
ncbi:MAG TPA: hypothetical protein PKK12_10730, partial [Candidatus Aminicenantes bacterium]|nr:hypothetical protein [Candidatus Aminicenantes bacterium]